MYHCTDSKEANLQTLIQQLEKNPHEFFRAGRTRGKIQEKTDQATVKEKTDKLQLNIHKDTKGKLKLFGTPKH